MRPAPSRELTSPGQAACVSALPGHTVSGTNIITPSTALGLLRVASRHILKDKVLRSEEKEIDWEPQEG